LFKGCLKKKDMKILVPIKRVPDYQVKVKLNADNSGIQTDGIKWIVNPFDEIAVEAALVLKEQGVATEVVVASVGPADVQSQLRYCMAMGADSGILVTHDGVVDSDLASRVLAELFKKGQYGLVVMGKQAIDSDANQTGQLLAARLDLPQACFASKIAVSGSDLTVTREVDGGLETLKLNLPAVITTDLRLNTPRYASLPNIMKAKKKPLEELALSALGVDPTPKISVLRLSAPAKRSAGKKVDSVEALVKALREEAKVF
jgi:electron transfer flavoprotein beta subunit